MTCEEYAAMSEKYNKEGVQNISITEAAAAVKHVAQCQKCMELTLKKARIAKTADPKFAKKIQDQADRDAPAVIKALKEDPEV